MKIEILPPVYFFILLIVQIVVHCTIPIKNIISPPYTYIGLILILAGTILNIWCNILYKQYRTTPNPNKLPTAFITSGPFKLSRNPMYIGVILILTGVAIKLGSIIPFIIPAIMWFILQRRFIPLEEKKMTQIFGNQYIEYKESVRQWL